MNTAAAYVLKLFNVNSAGMALLIIAGRFWSAMVSSLMGFLLRAPGLHVGMGTRIIGGRHISFGRGVYAGRNLWLEAVTSYRSQEFDPRITIGDYVCFSDAVHISAIASITIGSNCLFGSRIYVSDHNHGIYRGDRQSDPSEPPAYRELGGGGPVVIGKNVWIGDNSVIIGPVDIGPGAIIGANSVVRGIVEPNTMVAGAPAKPRKRFNSQTNSWESL